MAQKERLDLIRQMIRQNKRVNVCELSREFNVTEETIRRDLEKLEKEGLINRTYGGAVLNIENVTDHLDYRRRAEINKEAKTDMAQLLSDVIPHNAVIGADASSTVMEALHSLSGRSDITVMTNSTQILNELDKSSMNIILTGGSFNRNTYSLQGNIVRKVLKDYYMDIVLISCTALELERGVFDSNEEEAELKRVLVDRGRKIILLADHTKFNKLAFVHLMDLRSLDMIITDQEPAEEWKAKFDEEGIDLLYPGEAYSEEIRDLTET